MRRFCIGLSDVCLGGFLIIALLLAGWVDGGVVSNDTLARWLVVGIVLAGSGTVIRLAVDKKEE